MHFEGRRRNSATPNLTPLIDVVFLLLVFFMLTSHFVREQAIPVELPKAASGELRPEERLEVVVDQAGRFLVHEHLVETEALEGVLRKELAMREDRTVRVRGDRSASLAAAVQVLDTARRAGADGVDIITERQ